MSGLSKSASLSVMFFLVLGMLALWSFITQSTQWGSVYTNVFYLSVILIILSVVVKKKFEAEFVSTNSLKWQFIVGFSFGLLLVSNYLFGQSFSFLSPLSIPNVGGLLGILGVSSITLVFVMSVVPSEFEENLRSALLRPTIAEWLQDNRAIPVILMIFGALIFFVLDSFRIIGMGMLVLGFLSLDNGFLSKRGIRSKWVRYGISIVIVGVFFAVLHFAAYNTGDPAVSEALMFNAFLYAVIADSINTFFGGTTIPSKIAHTTNNAVVASASVGVPIAFAFVVVGIHAAILYAIATVGEKRGGVLRG